ncbi:MAG TPA: 1,6-anhydro-N-acetylmuramyl-L-alanine amidase AmpD [Pseudomonadales bacterium]|nr:1,6-anhydro-N-acetylmuramyl-L-alanine amidase AmpD [Pseudomonadales bacterium]
MLISPQHRLAEARWVPSPNQNERPNPADISLLVIHGISLPPDQFGGPFISDLFTNQLDCDLHPYFAQLKDLRVSAHLLIRRDGELVQFVAFDRRAWHAGVSRFRERENCNDFSIGIELEGADHIPYTDAQYNALAAVTKCLMKTYSGIKKDRIVGHADIAPGRKTDPGEAFDWPYFFSLLTDEGCSQ